MKAGKSSKIVAFLSGAGLDAQGRSPKDILAFSDREIEIHHDFIQWLFPLEAPSAAVPGSPVLTAEDIDQIRQSDACRANVIRAANRMVRFYAENDHWLVPFDHNHRRITRIIRSLNLLVGQEEAERFLESIESRVRASGAQVSVTSRRFWRDAIGS